MVNECGFKWPAFWSAFLLVHMAGGNRFLGGVRLCLLSLLEVKGQGSKVKGKEGQRGKVKGQR